MKKKNEAIKIINILKETYKDAKCSLDFESPFELVVAVMLSAQCTDERVNQVTPSIFCKYSTPKDFANIELEELESLIHSCGFYKNKAKNIKSCAQKLMDEFRRNCSSRYGKFSFTSWDWQKKCKCYNA